MSPTGRSDSRGGFTLLELVLVMLIICTVLAAASPSLRGFFVSRKTDDTATRIVSLTRLARSRAVSRGRLYRLTFDRRQRVFYLTTRRPEGFVRPSAGPGRSFPVPEEVELELRVPGRGAGTDHVDFFPDGRVEPALVRLTDIKGGAVEVVCRAPTQPFVVVSAEER